MAVRHSRRTTRGTTEYYDNREELEAAKIADERENRALLFGLIGFLVGGIAAYFALSTLAAADDLAKWMRFTTVLLSAGLTAYVASRLAEFLWNVIVVALTLLVIAGLGALLWHIL